MIHFVFLLVFLRQSVVSHWFYYQIVSEFDILHPFLINFDQITNAFWLISVFLGLCRRNSLIQISVLPKVLIYFAFSGSNSVPECQFSWGFIRFPVACLDSGIGSSGTKDFRYAGFDIWYLIPIWYQNLILIDQIPINIKFVVWAITFGSNLIQIWFW